MYFFMTLLSLFLLTGCTKTIDVAELPSPMTEHYLNEHMLIHYDSELQQTKVQTLTYHVSNYLEEKRSISVTLIADIYAADSTYARQLNKKISYYLWITFISAQWGEFTRAISVEGESLNVKPHFSNIRSGVYTETFSIVFTRVELNARKKNGFDLLLLGEETTIPVRLPPLYLSTFLTRIDQIEENRQED